MLWILPIVVGLLVFPTAAAAAGPMEHLRAYVTRVVEVLQDAKLNAEAGAAARRAALGAIMRDVFDFPEMARRILGRHWQARTATERAEFVQLLIELLEPAYLSQIERYGGEPIAYVGVSGDGDDSTIRTTIVPARGAHLPVDYRLHRRADRWLVYDVVIDGVSLAGSYRAQFDRILRTSSYEDLVDRIQSLEAGQASPATPSR